MSCRHRAGARAAVRCLRRSPVQRAVADGRWPMPELPRLRAGIRARRFLRRIRRRPSRPGASAEVRKRCFRLRRCWVECWPAPSRNFCPACGDATPLIVPVPLHKSKRSERGFNQAELIARAAVKRLTTAVETRDRSAGSPACHHFAGRTQPRTAYREHERCISRSGPAPSAGPHRDCGGRRHDDRNHAFGVRSRAEAGRRGTSLGGDRGPRLSGCGSTESCQSRG